MLAVFPFGDAVDAVVIALTHIVNGGSAGGYAVILIPKHPGLSAPFLALIELLPLAAPALVLYCLTRSGEGLASIGLERDHHPIRDLGRMFPIFAVAYFGAQLVGNVILHDLGIHAFPTGSGSLPTGYVFLLVLSAVVAGITEEIVVLGFVVRRLEQFGWRPTWVVTVAVLVRMSYHLYYGPGVLPIALWGLVSVLLYRHYRRLPAFIAVHILWDSTIFVTEFVHGSAVATTIWLAVLAAFVLWIVYRVDLSNTDARIFPPPPQAWPEAGGR